MSGEQQSGKAIKKSSLPLVGLIIGIFALVSSWVPILNNGAFVVGVLGLVIAAAGLVKVRKLPQVGNGLAIAAIVVNVLALVVVLATQSLYTSAIDEATSGVSVSTSQETAASDGETDSEESGSSASEAADYSKLKIGRSVTLDDGLVVRVKAVKTGLVNHDGEKATQVTVSYENGTDGKASFNVYDWKAENAKGAQHGTAYYSNAKDELGSGDLSKGGSVTGNVYFEGTPKRIVYDPLSVGENQDIGWSVK